MFGKRQIVPYLDTVRMFSVRQSCAAKPGRGWGILTARRVCACSS
ncbi:MAG: hypothetical protein ACLUI6_09380 [Butyricicoccus sp.]